MEWLLDQVGGAVVGAAVTAALSIMALLWRRPRVERLTRLRNWQLDELHEHHERVFPEDGMTREELAEAILRVAEENDGLLNPMTMRSIVLSARAGRRIFGHLHAHYFVGARTVYIDYFAGERENWLFGAFDTKKQLFLKLNEICQGWEVIVGETGMGGLARPRFRSFRTTLSAMMRDLGLPRPATIAMVGEAYYPPVWRPEDRHLNDGVYDKQYHLVLVMSDTSRLVHKDGRTFIALSDLYYIMYWTVMGGYANGRIDSPEDKAYFDRYLEDWRRRMPELVELHAAPPVSPVEKRS